MKRDADDAHRVCAHQDEMNELLQQRLDGDLAAAQAARLDAHLGRCALCAHDAQGYDALFEKLAMRVEVRPDFTASVMAALPPAAHEARARVAWMLPVAVFLLLAIGTVLIAGGSLSTAVEGTPFGLLGAVAEMVTATALAGAGLLGASWKALRLGVGEMMVQSPMMLVLLSFLIVGLNGLLFSYLRRRRGARQPQHQAQRGA